MRCLCDPDRPCKTCRQAETIAWCVMAAGIMLGLGLALLIHGVG